MEQPNDEAQPIDALLVELQRESEQRRVELRAIAAGLPEATSRRAVLRSMVGDVAHAPDRKLVAKRVVLKVLRAPADLVRRVRAR
jgi:hypothetical protein